MIVGCVAEELLMDWNQTTVEVSIYKVGISFISTSHKLWSESQLK